MQKLLSEPILLIKDAWGGKSLMVDFRPPSAGEPTDEQQKEKAGKAYREMMSHVKDVLADPKKVYPDYDPKEGYEIAGFVWFQGFNDLVGSYPGDPKARRASRTTPNTAVFWPASSATCARISPHRTCLS